MADGTGEWLSVRAAANRLGVSTFVFRAMAKRAGISIGGRTGHPQVPGSEVEALRSGTRIPPGSYGPGSVPYTDRNRHLLDAVVERHGWSEDQVAEAVGVDVDRVRRWRSTGVPNGYVPALRTLADSDTTDVAHLLPEGSRRRLDPRAREPQEDWVTLRRAASRLGMSSPALRRMAETAGLTIRHRGGQPSVLWSEVDGVIARSTRDAKSTD